MMPTEHDGRGWRRSGPAAVLLGLMLAGCAATGPADDAQLYAAAIPRAAVLAPAAGPLAPLAYPVAAVTWTKRDYATWAVGKVGQASATPAGYDTWITIEPQAQDLCRGTPADRVGMRLQQLLGLPPAAAAELAGKVLVRFRIDQPAATAIYRPCANPDPQATACTAPKAAAEWKPAFAQWFATQVEASYQPGGYPWTRRGFTYDWAPSSATHVGPQEYVVPGGTPVTILGVEDAATYCR